MNLGRLVFLAGIAAAVVLPVRLFVVEPIYIATPSMEPTLPVGAHIFMEKLTYRLRAPERGEIIVFENTAEEHDSVKRVIAVPGDTIELKDKKVHLNGKEVDEAYAVHKRSDEKLKGDDLGPLTVPNGHLFVLGDNRDESQDSSVWPDPFLPQSKVRGKVRGIY